MTKKFLVSLLISLGILVGGFGAAYAYYTFRANQEGFRQGGESQASRITMRVEAGMADANADFIPDDYYTTSAQNPGGSLSFSINNTSDFPIRVTKLELVNLTSGTTITPQVSSNKNGDGTYTIAGNGDCKQWATFLAPTVFDSWPTIAPHSILHVNGTDNSRLGAGMIHLASNTANGCQGATFAMTLNVTAMEWTKLPGGWVEP
jgi:hypothetical protein